VSESETPLDIEFVDPVDDVEVGRSFRFHVLQTNARGERHAVRIEELEFEFAPIAWGSVRPSDDPGVGIVEVVKTVVLDDVFVDPCYTVNAHYRPKAARTLAPKRHVRMAAAAIEVELAFAIGQEGKWKAFEPLNLPRPVDLSTAQITPPDGARVLVRDGKVFLRIEPARAIPRELALTFPNGEVAAIRIDGDLRDLPLERDERGRLVVAGTTPTPNAARPQAAPPAPAAPSSDAVGDELREELKRLRRYVASFGAAAKKKPDAATTESIRRRISSELSHARDHLLEYVGPASEELRALLRSAVEQIPDAFREGAEAAPSVAPPAPSEAPAP
jgi:hypothetical protein